MVYFVCETCNETLKKAKVERHFGSCKGCWGMTCIDCNVVFEGQDYREHSSCLTEDQKYQGALYKAPKAKVKKRGINEIWAEAVEQAASSAKQSPPAISGHLLRMGELGNVPRQEKKFKNFVRNSLRVYNEGVISQLWSHLDDLKEEMMKQELAQKEKEEREKGDKVVQPEGVCDILYVCDLI
ncbi:unnamed protein product [Choristocarpus tenellus]